MSLARLLIAGGTLLILAGVVVFLLGRQHLPVGRLPGDIIWQRKNTTFHFPVMTCLLLSLLASAVLWLFNRR